LIGFKRAQWDTQMGQGRCQIEMCTHQLGPFHDSSFWSKSDPLIVGQKAAGCPQSKALAIWKSWPEIRKRPAALSVNGCSSGVATVFRDNEFRIACHTQRSASSQSVSQSFPL